MNFNDITLGQIATLITTIGIISAFVLKIFTLFSQVKQNTKSVSRAHERIDNIIEKSEKQKSELIDKVEETNNAVNLICSAVSALIDDSLQDNQESKRRLREIKNKLDSKKEIV